MQEESTPKYHVATFNGTGGQLFAIQIVNVLLCIVTLGMYYPWARVNTLRFMYEETTFMGDQFVFHGTGKQLFIGFIKVVGIFLLLGFIAGIAGELGILLIYLCLIVLTPVAVHGALKYRMSHTSWRGIYFGYRGDLVELIKMYAKGIILTVLTIGIYGAWFAMDVQRYITGHIRAGSVKFGFDGKGGEYFKVFFLGYLLTIVTLGIYGFWWARNMFNYMADHTYLEHEGNEYYFHGGSTAEQVFRLGIGNMLLVFLTLGIGTPWAIVRTIKYQLRNMKLHGAFDPTGIEQTEPAYTDATGDMLGDALGL